MTSKFRTNKNDIKKIYNSIKHNYVYFKIKKNEIHFFAKQDESFLCFDFGLSLSVFSFTFNDMRCNLDIEINRGFRCRCCLCSCSWCICHIRLGWLFLFIFRYYTWMNTWYGYGICCCSWGLDSSGFYSLFFEILNFFTLFRLLDVPFTAIALVSSFAFKKATKCEWLLLREGSGIQRVTFMWGKS